MIYNKSFFKGTVVVMWFTKIACTVNIQLSYSEGTSAQDESRKRTDLNFGIASIYSLYDWIVIINE